MKAIVYYVSLLDYEKDDKRAKQLDQFLSNNLYDVIYTYYDAITHTNEKKRIGLKNLLKDLSEHKIEADAFVCLSAHDIGTMKNLLSVLLEINCYVPNIYFVDIELSTADLID
jgi:DNA invertase Pin-like site-specific DNA recombinase